jgi:hypothetical protein
MPPLTISEQYMNEMHEQFDYFATWEPGTPLHIGDIGELNHNEFSYLSNLDAKGINFVTQNDPAKGELKFSSSTGIRILTKLDANAALPEFNLNIGDIGIGVHFGEERGIVFEASGVEHQMIKDVDKLDQMILQAYNNNQWKDDWVVISDLMVADSGTVLISKGNDATVSLKAKTNVPNLSLANLNANFERVYENNMNTIIICRSGLTPLFKLRGIHRHTWGLGSTQAGGIGGRKGKLFYGGFDPELENPSPPYVSEKIFLPFN